MYYHIIVVIARVLHTHQTGLPRLFRTTYVYNIIHYPSANTHFIIIIFFRLSACNVTVVNERKKPKSK